MFFILEDDQRGKELSQILLNNGYYVSNDINDIKYAKYIYLGLRGIDNKNRVVVGTQTYFIDFELLQDDCLIFTIAFNSYLADICDTKGYRYYSLLEDDDYLLKNTIMTSEGLISFMINNIYKPLFHSRILVLGFGNCGKDICRVLKGFKANITVVVRKRELENEIKESGYNFMILNDLDINNFDYIINTIPSIIIDNIKLKSASKNTMFFDIASFPYGIDHHEATRLGLDTHIISSIPSLYYPKYCAEIIFKSILKKMKNHA